MRSLTVFHPEISPREALGVTMVTFGSVVEIVAVSPGETPATCLTNTVSLIRSPASGCPSPSPARSSTTCIMISDG